MITLKELVGYLDDYLDIGSFVDYCHNGMQVEGKEKIHRVATAVSSNLPTIEAAISQGADALIVHHGLFWNREMDDFKIEGSLRKKLLLLLENEISLLTYHLPLDAHQEVGNNWKAAKDLGWQELSSFCPHKNQFLGVKGIFSPLPIEAFSKKLEEYYGRSAITALGGKSTVKSAALVAGGAYKELYRAAKEGVDCFITGNVDEPAWNVAFEEKIHFISLGHATTEKIGPKALSEKIKQSLGLDSFFLDIYNPF